MDNTEQEPFPYPPPLPFPPSLRHGPYPIKDGVGERWNGYWMAMAIGWRLDGRRTPPRSLRAFGTPIPHHSPPPIKDGVRWVGMEGCRLVLLLLVLPPPQPKALSLLPLQGGSTHPLAYSFGP